MRTDFFAILSFSIAAAAVVGGTLCLAALATYDRKRLRDGGAFRWMLPWRNPRLSARGRRWMAWGFALLLPWWSQSLLHLLVS